MRNYISKTWNGIANNVTKDVYSKIGKKIAKDMTNKYKTIIGEFYADYKPHYYRRKYRSYFFISPTGTKSFTQFLKMDPDGKGFTIRLELDYKNIKSPYTSIVNGAGTQNLTGYVFINTWVFGKHGGQLPYNIIPEHLRHTQGLSENNWSPLKDMGWTWEPPRLEPSPMERMNAWFATYATNANFNKLTQNIVTESINKHIIKSLDLHGDLKGSI